MMNCKAVHWLKLFGVIIENKLNFKEHFTKLCKKASTKFHALARVCDFMSTEKLCLFMKAFIKLQFGYCPLIWMFHLDNVPLHGCSIVDP